MSGAILSVQHRLIQFFAYYLWWWTSVFFLISYLLWTDSFGKEKCIIRKVKFLLKIAKLSFL